MWLYVRSPGIAELEIVIDSHEHYAYRFAGKPVRTLARACPTATTA
jgi:hypothetical protein